MEPSETLGIAAQIAVAFAGFATGDSTRFGGKSGAGAAEPHS
jgi:hypothetical protein